MSVTPGCRGFVVTSVGSAAACSAWTATNLRSLFDGLGSPRNVVTVHGEIPARRVALDVTMAIPPHRKKTLNDDVVPPCRETGFGVRIESVDKILRLLGGIPGVWVTVVVQIDSDERVVLGEYEPESGYPLRVPGVLTCPVERTLRRESGLRFEPND